MNTQQHSQRRWADEEDQERHLGNFRQGPQVAEGKSLKSKTADREFLRLSLALSISLPSLRRRVQGRPALSPDKKIEIFYALCHPDVCRFSVRVHLCGTIENLRQALTAGGFERLALDGEETLGTLLDVLENRLFWLVRCRQ